MGTDGILTSVPVFRYYNTVIPCNPVVLSYPTKNKAPSSGTRNLGAARRNRSFALEKMESLFFAHEGRTALVPKNGVCPYFSLLSLFALLSWMKNYITQM